MLPKNIAVCRKINTESTFIFPFCNICGLNHWQVCASLKPDTRVLWLLPRVLTNSMKKNGKYNISFVTQELLEWTTDWLGKSVNVTHFSFLDGIVKNWLANRIVIQDSDKLLKVDRRQDIVNSKRDLLINITQKHRGGPYQFWVLLLSPFDPETPKTEGMSIISIVVS